GTLILFHLRDESQPLSIQNVDESSFPSAIYQKTFYWLHEFLLKKTHRKVQCNPKCCAKLNYGQFVSPCLFQDGPLDQHLFFPTLERDIHFELWQVFSELP